ncbi:MAG: hypothetical protein EA344_07495 [Alkalicoccus sp.]|nr:MAG: hypothetical protein EA344_07495 [Alkalicoccus sp.]
MSLNVKQPAFSREGVNDFVFYRELQKTWGTPERLIRGHSPTDRRRAEIAEEGLESLPTEAKTLLLSMVNFQGS